MNEPRHYDAEDIARLRQLVTEGVQVLQEIDDLKSSLSDTVKSIGKEVNIRPSQLNRVIRHAHKNNLGDSRRDFDEIHDILESIGRGEE